MNSFQDLDFTKDNNLIPAIIQHSSTGQVLMLGYMNQDAVQQTIDTKKVTFYSRSKKRLWIKGETSGNVLNLVSIQKDCDSDALLILARPEGPTCHTGNESCFFEEKSGFENDQLGFLRELEQVLYQRKAEMPEGSYTTKMFKKGLDKITQKVGEEAVETVIASKNEDDSEFIYEASDLVFHLMLLCVEKNIPFSKLTQELARRHQPK